MQAPSPTSFPCSGQPGPGLLRIPHGGPYPTPRGRAHHRQQMPPALSSQGSVPALDGPLAYTTPIEWTGGFAGASHLTANSAGAAMSYSSQTVPGTSQGNMVNALASRVDQSYNLFNTWGSQGAIPSNVYNPSPQQVPPPSAKSKEPGPSYSLEGAQWQHQPNHQEQHYREVVPAIKSGSPRQTNGGSPQPWIQGPLTDSPQPDWRQVNHCTSCQHHPHSPHPDPPNYPSPTPTMESDRSSLMSSIDGEHQAASQWSHRGSLAIPEPSSRERGSRFPQGDIPMQQSHLQGSPDKPLPPNLDVPNPSLAIDSPQPRQVDQQGIPPTSFVSTPSTEQHRHAHSPLEAGFRPSPLLASSSTSAPPPVRGANGNASLN